ncbi:hypothetical protein FIBSPDRAFT_1050728 [Athelia psychrophila]|uniref:Rho-GAP domain-containing protein n=1 Tax=Athelia psychrophila TaxID=1759441 RepID=A0A166AD91_9AGAM|nr:hypothetical protein FIBSPDRAFT_1050728 [Fibularhizoctonia sp. CBS 109695]
MAVLSLPLSFTNSFWTPDYRKGLEVLFNKLEQGLAENDEIIAFIRARAEAEGQLAMTLVNPAPTGHDAGTGFNADDGASLLMAFRGLQAESAAQGAAHRTIANELTTLVADPFANWANGYRERIGAQRALLLISWIKVYEAAKVDVARLKKQYADKTRRADEAEDDAKFAPNSEYDNKDKFTSPRVQPSDKPQAPPQRTATVSERIASRLKDLRLKAADAAGIPADETVFEVLSEGEKSPAAAHVASPLQIPADAKAVKVDKGKGRAVDEAPPRMASPPPMDALPPPTLRVEPAALPPIVLANVSFQRGDLSALLRQAKGALPLRAVRIPLLGEYQECFSGEELVAWLNEHVKAFGGDLDRAEDAARDLTERENLLRRIGELGNGFTHADDAYYQFRQKAFELVHGGAAETPLASPAKTFSPLTGGFMKRSGSLANVVAKALQTGTATAHGEPAYIRARREAEEADQEYRVAVRRLDRQRLRVEEKVEEGLKLLQKWETERLRAVKTVLLQYQATLRSLNKALDAPNERSSTLIAAYQPDLDLKALIERYRTGPFHPMPQVYESPAHDESDMLFGLDLRKWAPHGAEMTGENAKELYPNVLAALLTGLAAAYGKLPNDAEKRKAWIYEVPLTATHHLRESLNGIDPEQPIPADLLAKYDAPVIAGTVKLWILELDPPLATWEGWEDFRKLYPTVGGKANGEVSEQQHIQDLSATLQKLPRVHLYVLDAIASHLKNLINSTTVDEDPEMYLTKLALSMGRTILRPKTENEMTLHDRHPTLLFIDLIKNYDAILPPTISRKKRESERKVPVRKRTVMVDMRSTRANISAGATVRDISAAQPKIVAPPVPPLPSAATVSVPSTASTSPTVESQPSPTPSKPLTPPPPPPAVVAQAPKPPMVPPPPPTLPAAPRVPPPPPANTYQPPRPSFREPSPEDDTPPRPSFREPSPENDPPARPSFKEPPPEVQEAPVRPSFKEPEEEYISLPMPNFAEPPVSPPATPPPVDAARFVPLKRNSLMSQNRPGSPAKPPSRSPSPAEQARSSLSRADSGQNSSGYIRGPRTSRGPRAPGAGSVSSMVSSLNRHSVGGAPGSTPTYTRPTSGSPARPSSIVSDPRARGIGGRAPVLNRRTMESDAEDEVLR